MAIDSALIESDGDGGDQLQGVKAGDIVDRRQISFTLSSCEIFARFWCSWRSDSAMRKLSMVILLRPSKVVRGRLLSENKP